MPRYIVTLTDDEITELKALVQKGGKGYRIKLYPAEWTPIVQGGTLIFGQEDQRDALVGGHFCGEDLCGKMYP